MEDVCPKANSPPPPLATGGQELLQKSGGGRVLHSETAQSSLTVIFRWAIGGLTSVILIVLGPVNFQFQGPYVAIALRPVFRIVAAHVLGTVWSSCS